MSGAFWFMTQCISKRALLFEGSHIFDIQDQRLSKQDAGRSRRQAQVTTHMATAMTTSNKEEYFSFKCY
jgi:hypothetical protein